MCPKDPTSWSLPHYAVPVLVVVVNEPFGMQLGHVCASSADVILQI